MSIGRVRNGDVEIAYETVGPAGGEPLLSILGVGTQMITWPEDFCTALVRTGFELARMDNRDCGASTHLAAAGRPSRAMLALRPAAAAPID